MSQLPPLNADMARLLDALDPPPISADFADRVVASTLAAPSLPRLRKTFWRRRATIAVAIGSLVSVAAAAAIAPETMRKLPVVGHIMEWVVPVEPLALPSRPALPAADILTDAPAAPEPPLVPNPEAPVIDLPGGSSIVAPMPMGSPVLPQQPPDPVSKMDMRTDLRDGAFRADPPLPSLRPASPRTQEERGGVSADDPLTVEPAPAQTASIEEEPASRPQALPEEDSNQRDILRETQVERTAVPTRADPERVRRERNTVSPVRPERVSRQPRIRQAP